MSELIPLGSLTRARPRWWDDPYRVLIRASLVMGWLPGFTLGLVLMLELALLQRAGIGWWPHAQTHAQAQLFGFVGLFFFGVATQILPRFFGQPLAGHAWLSVGAVLLAAGHLGRLSVQPFGASELRNGLMLASGVLGVVGAGLIMAPFVRIAIASSRPREAWQAFMVIAFSSWALGSVTGLLGVWSLSQGQLLVPQPLNELGIVLGLWGFAAPVTCAVGMRVFPNFLLLRPSRPRVLRASIGLYPVGLVLLVGAWLGQLASVDFLPAAQAVRGVGWLCLASAIGLFVLAIRLFETPARASVSPHITHPTRLWFRLAYVYLLLSVGLAVWLALREWQSGAPPSATELSAQRHAMAMGYLMPIIVGMAGRILPEFSGEMTRHPRVLAVLVWSWLIGAALRVGGELWSGYTGPGTAPMTLGATIAFIGFVWFSVKLWGSTTRGRRSAREIGPSS